MLKIEKLISALFIKWIRLSNFGLYAYEENYKGNEPFEKVNIFKKKINNKPTEVT